MNGVSIVEAIRTPFGRFGGKLRQHSAVDLGALVVRAALDRAGLQAQEVGETIFGTALLAASTMVAARQVNFKASIPASTPSLTIDRACCSSMTCIGLASMKIRLGEASMILAGGLDSSSQTPFLMRDARWGKRLGDFTVEDPMQMRNPINQKAIALVTGEMAVKWGVSRDEQDDWACASHQKYFEALDRGVYRDEILPVEVQDGGASASLAIDESPRRDISRERLRSLPPVYNSPTITPGNAPGLNDGASVTVLMSSDGAKRRGIEPLGEIVSYAQLSEDLESSVYLPGMAIQSALQMANLSIGDLKRIEINEAFAAMPLVSTRRMAGDDAKLLRNLRAITNVNGGSVALGHPPGASGARVVMALARELRRIGGGYGAAAICGGFGQADAVIVKVR